MATRKTTGAPAKAKPAARKPAASKRSAKGPAARMVPKESQLAGTTVDAYVAKVGHGEVIEDMRAILREAAQLAAA